VPVFPLGIERLADGRTLIADGGASSTTDARAIEVDSLGRLVWAYVKNDVPFLHTARRLPNGNTLMSASFGDKVVEANRDGEPVWMLADGLAYPNEAYRLANGNTLITDRDGNRVIEVTPERTIAWGYWGLAVPHNGNRLANGHTLICDSDNDRIIEVDQGGSIVWQHDVGLDWPRSAQRLPDGRTLIADTRHSRVIEVDSAGNVLWDVSGLTMAYEAARLANGNTLVSAGYRVVELAPDKSIVWQYPNTVPVLAETLQVVNPTSGCSLYVHIHRPAYAGPANRVPGVAFVPGGLEYGSSYDTTGLPDRVASDGFAFLHFDPDDRGLSGAYPENYGGYVHQDGLRACLAELASRDYVDTSRLGVYTREYGITMASGMIARHPELPVRFLLDCEGPADRSQTCQDSGGFVPVPADSESFWQEREAARFMKQVPAAYLRMQTEVDHDSDMFDNRHAIQLIDSATAVAYGGAGISVWTRVNDSLMNPPNQVYGSQLLSGPPVWVPETQEAQNLVRVLLYLHELVPDLQVAAAEPRQVGTTVPLQVYPRPCRGLLRVELRQATRARDLRVHDVCGRLVASATVAAGRTQATMDLRDLQPGVYYVALSGAGTVPVVVVR